MRRPYSTYARNRRPPVTSAWWGYSWRMKLRVGLMVPWVSRWNRLVRYVFC